MLKTWLKSVNSRHRVQKYSGMSQCFIQVEIGNIHNNLQKSINVHKVLQRFINVYTFSYIFINFQNNSVYFYIFYTF